MADLMVTVKQLKDTPTSAGTARQHQVVIDRPKEKGGLDEGAMGGEMLLLALGGLLHEQPDRRGQSADGATFDKLIQIAERGCIVHNTLAGSVRVEVSRM